MYAYKFVLSRRLIDICVFTFNLSATSQFTATWSDAVLQVVLSMERIRDEIFQSKRVKLSINIASEDCGADKLKSLATVNFDLATLRLKFVDKTGRSCTM